MYLHIHEYKHTHPKKSSMIEHSCNHKIEEAAMEDGEFVASLG